MTTASAALFDLDGVIVDTAVHHFAAWRQTAAELGFTLADEDEERLKGVGRMDALRIVLEIGGVEVDEATALRLADEKNARYVDAIAAITPADMLPGAQEVLEDLRARGVRTALGSASRNAPLILERLGITGLFDAIVDGSVVTEAKPHPRVFLAGAEALGVDPATCIVFEDAIAGVQAANAAGMTAVGIGDPAVLTEAAAVIPGLHAVDALAAHGITFAATLAARLEEETMTTAPVRLDAAPFHLDAAAQEWVTTTLAGLSLEQKVGQLFCLLGMPGTTEQIDAELAVAEPGGYMRRPSLSHEIIELNRYIQDRCTVPALIAANIEAGASGAAFDQTSMGSPLQAAATDDPSSAYRMGEVCAVQGRAMGVNWAFSPIIDIQMNPHNPIVLNRGFGSETARVRDMGVEFVKGLQDNGVAASVKHWPGDGVDDRDQHLITTVNTLSTDEWDATFGEVYQAVIDAGALTVMAAHIALPAYSRALRPGIKDEDILPASLAPEITTDLLRGKLGFNGLVVTDATLMAGMQMSMPRAQAVPQSIAAGCDMFLFADDFAADYAHMLAGVEAGVVTEERLDQAVTRVLAVKAALGLHAATTEELAPGLEGVNRGMHEGWAAQQADAAVTLVKDLEEGLLPLSPESTPRVLLYSLRGGSMPSTAAADKLAAQLSERGFEAAVHQDPPREATMFGAVGRDGAVVGDDLRDHYDLVIYVADVPPTSNHPTARLDWTFWTAANLPRFAHEVPTIVVSVANPFHLQDVPRVKTYINAYASNDATIAAVAGKLTGESEFRGINPVDPFMGYWDARL
ncbi:beta-phosphoglucomutase [Demequina sp. SYSU T00192]|uniref:beta-N-acetylhexosaminidase n=1 Tax=Demequina litoralis TaxID=3051660 RepID=A0ABT8G6X0_9MICO|nr:beta-phosphoglucomutase [Demequina sp. SYSU T00192]MDN4474742.1 beta-phosphoglucomutase [Demequina sp. SYSU T00192]